MVYDAMNSNYRRQLQEAYQQGYYDQLNEGGAAVGGAVDLGTSLWRAIRGGADDAAALAKPMAPPPGVAFPKHPWELPSHLQTMLMRLNELLREIFGSGVIGIGSKNGPMGGLMRFLQNPTRDNMLAINDVLIQYGVQLMPDGRGILRLQTLSGNGLPAAMDGVDAANQGWVRALRELINAWNFTVPF